MRLAILFIPLLSLTLAYGQEIDKKRLLNDVEILSSARFEGRKTGTRGNKLADEYISERFRDAGLRSYLDSFRHPFTFKAGNSTIRGTNILGYKAGKSDQVIVISAHYDHVGMNGKEIYYGADDNASGISALLAFAEYYRDQTPNHTLIFAAFDAEESGLRGAHEFVANPPVNKEKLRLNVNMDMISHNDKGELYAAGTFRNPMLKMMVDGADSDIGIRILFGHDLPGTGPDDWTMQSDQGAFAKEGIPFLYFGVEDHKDYHKPSDTFQNINEDFFYGATRAILNSIIKLDGELEKRGKVSPK